MQGEADLRGELNFCPLVVPKRRLGMRPAKRRFAPLINPPDSGFVSDGEIRQAALGNDRKISITPEV